MVADVFTLLLLMILSSVVVAAALLLLNGGRRQDGLQYWAGGLLLTAAGYVVLLLRGQIPVALSIVLTNVLLCAAFPLLLLAVRCFYGLPLHWSRAFIPVASIALLAFIFQTNFAARVAVTGIVFAGQIGWVLWTLLRYRPPHQNTMGRGAPLLVYGLGCECAVVLGRGLAALFFPLDIATMLQGNTVQTLTFMVSLSAILVTSFGFVFMAKERADAANVRLAAQDALTGIANRRALVQALESELARAQCQRTPLALLMLDIDHFKHVNDQYGHLAGDQVLRHVVQVVEQRLRTQDLLGRYGGEEFLLLLPHTDLAGAQQLGQQLCEAVQAAPCDWHGQSIAVTVSVGISVCAVGEQPDWETLLLAADKALYRAKGNGRNRVEVAPVLL